VHDALMRHGERKHGSSSEAVYLLASESNSVLCLSCSLDIEGGKL
jgi:hypothetical protein